MREPGFGSNWCTCTDENVHSLLHSTSLSHSVSLFPPIHFLSFLRFYYNCSLCMKLMKFVVQFHQQRKPIALSFTLFHSLPFFFLSLSLSLFHSLPFFLSLSLSLFLSIRCFSFTQAGRAMRRLLFSSCCRLSRPSETLNVFFLDNIDNFSFVLVVGLAAVAAALLSLLLHPAADSNNRRRQVNNKC